MNYWFDPDQYSYHVHAWFIDKVRKKFNTSNPDLSSPYLYMYRVDYKYHFDAHVIDYYGLRHFGRVYDWLCSMKDDGS